VITTLSDVKWINPT